MAFFWLWRSTGRAPGLTKRARTMVDFREELADRAAPKPYLHRPQLLAAAPALPSVASGCFPSPVGHIVRTTELFRCFKQGLPIWRERRCSVSCPSAGCFVHGGLGHFFSGGPPSRSGKGPGDGGAEAEPSPEESIRFGPFSGSIGKYRWWRSLGAGGFAVVKAAFNTETGDVVAIKCLSKHPWKALARGSTVDPSTEVRQEIFAMRTLSHPNIVQLLEVMATRDKVFLVMELVRGGTLQEALNARNGSGPVSEATSRQTFQQIMTAVEFCHGKGVCHRDLKPANVLLDRNGNAKVADFGLSALTGTGDSIGKLFRMSQVGTFQYMAPEIPDTGFYSGEVADVYSCGIILYILLSNAQPFDMKLNRAQFQHKKQTADYFPLPGGISADARNLITSMLNPDPTTRISVAEIFQDSWFKQDYQPPDFRLIKEVAASMEEIENAFAEPVLVDAATLEPAKLDAFPLIAGAKSFNLEHLARTLMKKEDIGWEEKRYTSKLPAPKLHDRITDTMASFYNVQWRGHMVRFDAAASSPEGPPLCVVAEMFQAQPQQHNSYV